MTFPFRKGQFWLSVCSFGASLSVDDGHDRHARQRQVEHRSGTVNTMMNPEHERRGCARADFVLPEGDRKLVQFADLVRPESRILEWRRYHRLHPERRSPSQDMRRASRISPGSLPAGTRRVNRFVLHACSDVPAANRTEARNGHRAPLCLSTKEFGGEPA
jgi:hypothetical protein